MDMLVATLKHLALHKALELPTLSGIFTAVFPSRGQKHMKKSMRDLVSTVVAADRGKGVLTGMVMDSWSFPKLECPSQLPLPPRHTQVVNSHMMGVFANFRDEREAH